MPVRYFVAVALAIVVGIGHATESIISSEEHAFRVVTVTRGLEHPWGLAFLPDGRRLVTERPGRLRLALLMEMPS